MLSFVVKKAEIMNPDSLIILKNVLFSDVRLNEPKKEAGILYGGARFQQKNIKVG